MTPSLDNNLEHSNTDRLLGALTQGFTSLSTKFDSLGTRFENLVHENDRQHSELGIEVLKLHSNIRAVRRRVKSLQDDLSSLKLALGKSDALLEKDLPKWTIRVLLVVIGALYGDAITGGHVHGSLSKFVTGLASK